MPRRSPRKKDISPEAVIDSGSDNENFMAVASDDHLDEDVVNIPDTDEDKGKSLQDGKKRKKFVPFMRKDRAPALAVQSEEDDDLIEITPPPTPTSSLVKLAGGKKRAIANLSCDSDDGDVFIPSPTRDSPKKPRAKEPSTPSKGSARQAIFDAAVSRTKKEAVAPLFVSKGPGDKGKGPGTSKSPLKAAPTSEISDSTVYQADVEMRQVCVPELDRCQIYNPDLVDPRLKSTYRKIPRLPRMADYGPAWGHRSGEGGFYFSGVLDLYDSPDVEYLKSLLVFSHDKAGNVGNLSRIDPSILGVKDAGSYTKNALYLHGVSSAPLLCFSLVLVAKDTHESGRIIRSDPKEWVVKDIAGVLLAMELERFIAVLGLAFDLPYVPDDSSRREGSLLYFSMIENAFYFSTTMVSKNEFDKSKASSSSMSTPKRKNQHKIFAPASPAFSSKAAVPIWAAHRPSLRATETVPVYDGRNRQLKVPDELGKIPNTLPRYVGSIPEYSLALVAYTVSTYVAPSGPRKDLITANLHIQFGVVLHEPTVMSTEDGSDNEGRENE